MPDTFKRAKFVFHFAEQIARIANEIRLGNTMHPESILFQPEDFCSGIDDHLPKTKKDYERKLGEF